MKTSTGPHQRSALCEPPLLSTFLAGALMAFVAALVLAPAKAPATNLMVFAAASLTDALKAAAMPYEKQTGDRISFNFAGSSTLARQIEEGAPADIFFSADEAKMDRLEKRGLILKGTRTTRLSNTLVIVTTAGSRLDIQSPADLAGPNVKHIALADPKAVPAGIYARIYLEKKKLWARVKPKVVATENVRAALAAVDSGNVEVGIVYRTDAAIAKDVHVVYRVPRNDGPAIRYPMAVVKDSKHAAAARKFLHYLDSAAAAHVFEKYGFIVLHQ